MTKQEIIQTYARHEGDTGSPEVQIALLTERINHLNEHLKVHKKEPVADGRPAPRSAGLSEEHRHRGLSCPDRQAGPAQVSPRAIGILFIAPPLRLAERRRCADYRVWSRRYFAAILAVCGRQDAGIRPQARVCTSRESGNREQGTGNRNTASRHSIVCLLGPCPH